MKLNYNSRPNHVEARTDNGFHTKLAATATRKRICQTDINERRKNNENTQINFNVIAIENIRLLELFF